jgi:hypothetical protein
VSRRKRARSPTQSPSAAVSTFSSPSVMMASTIKREQKEVPKGKVSRDGSDSVFGWWVLDTSLAGKSRSEVIASCRDAIVGDTDAAGSLRDLLALANPGYQLNYEGGKRAVAQAETATKQLLDRINIDLDTLINNQLAEVYVAGASSLEWYPTPSRNQVQDVEIVLAEELQRRKKDDQRWWEQQPYGARLNPQTHVYSPYMLRGKDPYGTPAMVAALTELERKARIVLGTDKVINLMGEAAFLTMKVPKPTPSYLGVSSEQDPNYASRLAAYYKANVDLALSARERGIMVTEAGVDSSAVPLTQGAAGLADLELSNNLKVWSGLMTLPFMRGKMDSTTQALAQVVYPIQLAHAVNMQQVVKKSIEQGLNLNLRLAGIAATVSLEFQQPENPFKKDQAQASLWQAQTDQIYYGLYGLEYLKWAATRDGFDPDLITPQPATQTQPPEPPDPSEQEEAEP